MSDHTRDPCPLVIVNDFGGAFAMGLIGGSIWHSVKGFRNSPQGERWRGVKSAVRLRAPTLGGNFGAWGGTFSIFDCTVKAVRRTEDPWNAIIAGFFTGGALAIRGGWRHARNNAIICAFVLAGIEGANIAISRMFAEGQIAPAVPEQMAA